MKASFICLLTLFILSQDVRAMESDRTRLKTAQSGLELHDFWEACPPNFDTPLLSYDNEILSNKRSWDDQLEDLEIFEASKKSKSEKEIEELTAQAILYIRKNNVSFDEAARHFTVDLELNNTNTTATGKKKIVSNYPLRSRINKKKPRSKELSTELVKQVKSGDCSTKEIKELLNDAIRIDAKDRSGYTLLHLAAERGNSELCALLLSSGADVTMKTKGGWTPLQLAANNGHLKACKKVLKKRVQEKDTDYALFLAHSMGHRDISELLIEKGANCNTWLPTQELNDKLIKAFNNKNFSLDEIRKLIESGASASIKIDEHGQTPLHFAAKNELLDLAEFLLAHKAKVNARTTKKFLINNTPLQTAIQTGNLAMCKLLIDNAAEVNPKRDITPLHDAVDKGFPEIAKLLIKHGADVNQAVARWSPPLLQLAAKKGSLPMCRLLLKNGAKVDSIDSLRSSRTPLFFAVLSKSFGICKLLIDLGADINTTDSNNDTPLILAARKNYTEIYKLLISRGALITDTTKKSSRIATREKGDTDQVGTTHLLYAATNGNLELCKLLVEKGINVNASDANFNTPLIYAAKTGNVDLCRFLIEQGAAIEAKNQYEHTALTVAIQAKHLAIYKLLLEHKATIPADALHRAQYHRSWKIFNSLIQKDIPGEGLSSYLENKNRLGSTLLNRALKTKAKKEICLELIKRGAKIETKDTDGKTPLYYAAKNGMEDICKILLKKLLTKNAPESKDRVDAALRTFRRICRTLPKDIRIKILRSNEDLSKDVAQILLARIINGKGVPVELASHAKSLLALFLQGFKPAIEEASRLLQAKGKASLSIDKLEQDPLAWLENIFCQTAKEPTRKKSRRKR